MNTIKNQLVLALFWLLAAGLFISCGASKANEIRIVYRSGATWDPWFAAIKANYEALHPQYSVNLIPITASEADYYAKVTLMLQTDRNLDIIMEDTFTLQANVEAGYLHAIENIESWHEWPSFYDGVQSAGAVDGKLYGIPFVSDTRGIFYNKEILAALGLSLPWQPQSWQDIINLSHLIQANYPDKVPISMYLGKGEATTMQTFQMLLYGTQDEMYESGKWLVSSPAMLRAFEFIEYMSVNKLSLDPTYLITPSGLGAMWSEKFANGDLVMLLDGNWISGWGFDYYHEGRSRALELYDIAPMPYEQGSGYITMSGGWVFSISEKSQKKDLALDFIKFATSKEQLLSYFEGASDISPRRDVAATESYKAFDPIRVKATEFLEFARYRPANSEYPQASLQLYSVIEELALGNFTALQAMRAYEQALIRSLGEDRVLRKEFNQGAINA